mmetsp:Transcript_11435/g.18636  ORF Transcript_11435/g.18636 Transcript_11435/m.18636 type:complete len:238 (+) Transcript_11435:75-788(+)
MEEETELNRTDDEEEDVVQKHELNTYLRVGPEEYERFSAMTSEADRWTCMSSFSTVDYHSDNARSEILQEYLFHLLHFCLENQMTFPQMSGIVVLAEAIFTKCALNADLSTEDAKLIFRELVKENMLSTEDTEANISINVLKKLATFFMENFIRHLSLYQMAFSQNQKECREAKYIAVQTPLLFPSLMEATNYNGEDIEMDTARTGTEYTEGDTARSEYEQDDTARTDYTEYTEGED